MHLYPGPTSAVLEFRMASCVLLFSTLVSDYALVAEYRHGEIVCTM